VVDAEDAGPEIIHHDERLLIVHKPPGLPTTAPISTEPCLVRWVPIAFHTFKRTPRPGSTPK
jgi:23S rRNA-/tRNA-specific pseudouridylate synthase